MYLSDDYVLATDEHIFFICQNEDTPLSYRMLPINGLEIAGLDMMKMLKSSSRGIDHKVISNDWYDIRPIFSFCCNYNYANTRVHNE